ALLFRPATMNCTFFLQSQRTKDRPRRRALHINTIVSTHNMHNWHYLFECQVRAEEMGGRQGVRADSRHGTDSSMCKNVQSGVAPREPSGSGTDAEIALPSLEIHRRNRDELGTMITARRGNFMAMAYAQLVSRLGELAADAGGPSDAELLARF